MNLSIAQTKRIVALAAVAAATAVAALAGPAAAPAAAEPLYPDLRMRAPDSLQTELRPVNDEQHYVIAFTSRPWNAGEGPFEVDRTPTLSGIADLTQRIYESPVGFREERLGSVVFDPTDFTFPIPEMARYELWTKRDFLRAQSRGFTRGTPLLSRDSISFCVADTERVKEDAGPRAYSQCTKFVTGISPGWADVQSWFEEYQSFDLGTTMLPDGDYVVRVIVDPGNLLHESAGKADPARESEVANSAVTYFTLIQGRLAGIE